MTRHILSLLAAIELVSAFPWVAQMPGVDSSLLNKGYRVHKRDDPNCPVNPDHPGAAEYSDDFLILGPRMGSLVHKRVAYRFLHQAMQLTNLKLPAI